MNTNKIIGYALTVLILLAFSALSLTGCPPEPEPDPGGPTDITYTVAQSGGAVDSTGNGTADTTGITFTFSKSVDSLNLSATDITVSGAASKGTTALSGTGASRTLAITVNAAGLATVSIAKDGIVAAQKSVTVYKEGQTAPEYWQITWNLNGGAAGTGAYPAQIVKGAVLARPSPDPTKAGNTFGGWYTNSGPTQAYNFASNVTANLNLYAKWDAAGNPAHTHNWGAWAATELAGTEERVCANNAAHIEARLTGTGRFTFELISGVAAYRVSAGTAIAGIERIPAYYRPSTENQYQPVTEIGDYAFQDCTSLTGIHIPASVTSIGNRAFYGSYSLASITVDENNPNYASEGGILYNKAKTTLITYPSASGAITIPARVTSIDDYAFYGCTGLTAITIPAGVTEIGRSAFSGESYYSNQMALATVTFATGSQLVSIGDYAFQYCRSLASITIPAGVTSIGSGAFSYCTSLASVTFAAGFSMSIGNWFSGISSITTVNIPASVTEIGDGAFYNCTGLAAITVDSANTAYASQDGILYNKAKTSFVHIPRAISGNVTIPDGVTSIGSYAPYVCLLPNVSNCY